MASAPNKQNDIEPITSTPKIFTGTKTENNKAEKPTTTDSPLKRMPFPEIRNVLDIASSNFEGSYKQEQVFVSGAIDAAVASARLN